MKPKITASTRCPANMFAKRRTAKTTWRINRPSKLNDKDHRDQRYGDGLRQFHVGHEALEKAANAELLRRPSPPRRRT